MAGAVWPVTWYAPVPTRLVRLLVLAMFGALVAPGFRRLTPNRNDTNESPS